MFKKRVVKVPDIPVLLEHLVRRMDRLELRTSRNHGDCMCRVDTWEGKLADLEILMLRMADKVADHDHAIYEEGKTCPAVNRVL